MTATKQIQSKKGTYLLRVNSPQHANKFEYNPYTENSLWLKMYFVLTQFCFNIKYIYC